MRDHPAFAVMAVLVAMVSIQFGASLAKQLFPIVGPGGTTALRLFFSALILILVWRPWRRSLAGSWPSLALYGGALGGMNLLFFMALARIPLGVAVALEFTGPLAVALMASRRPRDYVWVILAVVGILLLLPLTRVSAQLDAWGVTYALAAGACWALYIVFGKRVGGALHGGTAAAVGMGFAALLTVPIGVVQTGPALFQLGLLPMALAIAVLSSALPYSLEMIALKQLPTQTFSILMSVEPAIAALSGLLFLGEQLAALQWLAIGLVISASIGSTLSARAPELPPT